jgi:hypothetical protein
LKGRLNLFQASMLRWRGLHPYNAVHVVRVGAALDAQQLRRAIDAQLAAFGLAGLELDPIEQRFEYRGGATETAVNVLPATVDPEVALDAEIERQLNVPFARAGRIDPFRFFALERGNAFDLGLAYDHFVAAGDSIVLLMKAIVDRYEGSAHPAAPPPAPGLYPATYGRLLLANLAPVLSGLRKVPAMVTRFRHVYRPRYPHGSDHVNAFARFRIEPAAFAALLSVARQWQVTLNDLLIAIVMQALAPLTEGRREAARRNQLAVASIVNIRRDCGPAAAGMFGQFLSSFMVSHPVPPGVGLEQLARDVHAETSRIKGERLYLQTLLALGATGMWWRFMSDRRRRNFHSKAYPVWAGMTSVNVDALWQANGAPSSPPRYLRAVSTGPTTPLVFAVTSAGGALEIGMSFRTAAFTREEAATMAAAIARSVNSLPG